MMLCTRCGASNQPASKFCLSCGAPLPAAGAAQGAGQQGHGAPPQGPHQGAPAHAPPPPGGAPQGPPPGYGQPPPGGAPGWGAQQPNAYGPPPGGGWSPNAYAPPPPGGAPQPQHNPWGTPPPEQGGFAPAGADNRMVVGSPQGLNPFGATMGPDAYQGPNPAGQPTPGYGAQPQGAPAHGAPAASPGPWGAPQPQGAPPGWGSAVVAQPAPAPIQQPGERSQSRSHDPSAFAATAPPPDPPIQGRPSQPGGSPSAGRGEGSFVSTPGSQTSRPAAPGTSQKTSVIPGRDPEQLDPNAIRALAGFLVSYEQSDLGVFWPLYQGQNVIGRKGAAPGLDIEIDHPTTSSRHAVIYASARPGRLKIEDPGSTNGTFLTESMLERGKKHELRDGDALRFGGFSVIVKII